MSREAPAPPPPLSAAPARGYQRHKDATDHHSVEGAGRAGGQARRKQQHQRQHHRRKGGDESHLSSGSPLWGQSDDSLPPSGCAAPAAGSGITVPSQRIRWEGQHASDGPAAAGALPATKDCGSGTPTDQRTVGLFPAPARRPPVAWGPPRQCRRGRPIELPPAEDDPRVQGAPPSCAASSRSAARGARVAPRARTFLLLPRPWRPTAPAQAGTRMPAPDASP